ncbi:MAG: hypothetical protein ACO3D0_11600 [Ilumatobacteraceae bacterium]
MSELRSAAPARLLRHSIPSDIRRPRPAEAAGARPTLIGLVIVFLVAAVTAVPALVWLFVLVNRDEWQSDVH